MSDGNSAIGLAKHQVRTPREMAGPAMEQCALVQVKLRYGLTTPRLPPSRLVRRCQRQAKAQANPRRDCFTLEFQ
jgi:hypothetical protein